MQNPLLIKKYIDSSQLSSINSSATFSFFIWTTFVSCECSSPYFLLSSTVFYAIVWKKRYLLFFPPAEPDLMFFCHCSSQTKLLVRFYILLWQCYPPRHDNWMHTIFIILYLFVQLKNKTELFVIILLYDAQKFLYSIFFIFNWILI